jgi:hypothetical protein
MDQIKIPPLTPKNTKKKFSQNDQTSTETKFGSIFVFFDGKTALVGILIKSLSLD